MTTLLDLMREPMIVRPVDPDGPTVKADEVLEWGKPWSGFRYARIELHQHDDGLWMWARSFELAERAATYRVGPKWGRFAKSRADALHYAIEDLLRDVEKAATTQAQKALARQIVTWTRGLS